MNKLESRPVPKRAKSFQHTRRFLPAVTLLEKLLQQPIMMTEQQYQHLIDGLWQGDTLMDALVDWLFEDNTRQRKQLFEQALHEGTVSIKDCPDILQQFFAHVETQPEWLDQAQLQQAVAFMHSVGLNANYVLRDLALMGGYLLAGFNQALVMTGALNKGASQRLAETSKWWMDCTAPHGLERFSAGFKSTIHVRLIHALVRRNLHRKPEWNAEHWGLPICQIDMAATNLAFCSLFLLGLRGLGIVPTRQESQAVMHFWKYLGWLMGVDPRWLVDCERDGHILLYQSLFTQAAPDWTSQALGSALAQEPLQKEFKRWQTLQRHYSYHKHLSISRLFLSAQKMQQLGLPKYVLPWFPAFLIPQNLIGYRIQRRLPVLKSWQQRRGRQAQLNYMATFGSRGDKVIQPEKNHPAYIAG
ncbi:oxygenase MpaB family protein [Alkanindiges illinoisensis]|uniref:DUF2236 domain-containing protein n=1 Tax=Alkanindiges illinoisensis TaxID=197183 RepID=A0A4Y7XAX1_9GAMM|nr:oxygenase MpaB family protein [Alkanindiges illinoisensis]TEU24217.1 DUF2236 domain-containing protein [Alkanindiges illinoisensis]